MRPAWRYLTRCGTRALWRVAMRVMSGWPGGGACVSRCVRWLADLSNPCHMSGEVPQTDHVPPPPEGGNGCLVLGCVLRCELFFE
eukprot:5051472-Prymnesium_polylepis.2